MLDDYKDNEFSEYVKKLKKYYHAYIFEVDSYEDNYQLILSFAKTIICKNHYTNNEKCNNCNICHLVDNNSFADLKIIEPDGASIKKEQILALQKELSLKSSNDTNQVYIIKEANKMNLSAANSLLKFIEEPVDGIYGFLVTNDRKQIISTILSRCNLISLKNSKSKEYLEDDIKRVCDFINLIHNKKEDCLAELKETFFTFYKTREEIINFFNLMEIVLDNKINIEYQGKNTLNLPFYDIIKSSLSDISSGELIFYLEKIVNFKNKLITILNLNLNLFMDKFIIELSRVR